MLRPITTAAILLLATLSSQPATACTRLAYAEGPHAACVGDTVWGEERQRAELPAGVARRVLAQAVRDAGRYPHQQRAMAAYGYALALLPEDGQITYRAWLDALTAGWRATASDRSP